MKLPDYDEFIEAGFDHADHLCGRVITASAEDEPENDEADDDDEEFPFELPLKITTGPMIFPRSSWIADQGSCVWLRDDPRSVTAMLHGKGDGREKLYEKFAKYMRRKYPDITEANLAYRYSEYAEYMDSKIAAECEQARQNTARKWSSILNAEMGVEFEVTGERFAVRLGDVLYWLFLVSSVGWLVKRWIA